MLFRTDVSIVTPCSTDGSIRLRVISSAPDSTDHAMCRAFYRDTDIANADLRNDYTPYAGWIPPQTAESLEFIRGYGAFKAVVQV